MTVYKFYFNNSDDETMTNRNRIEDMYPLYAITNNKKHKKEFLKIRNKKNFVVTKTEMDKSEWLEFAKKRRGNVLARHYLGTVDKNYNYTEVPMVITEHEYAVISEQFDNTLTSMAMFNPLILTPEVFQLLTVIEYPSLWGLYGASEEMVDIMATDEYLGEYPSAPTYIANELNLLLDYNSATFF